MTDTAATAHPGDPQRASAASGRGTLHYIILGLLRVNAMSG